MPQYAPAPVSRPCFHRGTKRASRAPPACEIVLVSATIAILPILFTILAGYLIAALRIVPRDKWDGINALNFNILIPATLIYSIAVSDLSGIASGTWIWALLLTLAVAAAVVLALRFLVGPDRLSNPRFTTLFQATTRWNAFIALAAGEQFIGSNGIALLALAMAVLIPIINVGNIVVLAAFGKVRASFRAVLSSILQNPLVIGCAIGLLINLTGMDLPGPLLSAVDLVARAALGIGVLAVGAGIALNRLVNTSWQVWLGVTLRLVLVPLVFVVLAASLRLSLDEALAGVLIFGVPAAANGYVIALRMGGDADLYADLLTWQTILSLALLPVWAMVVQRMLG